MSTQLIRIFSVLVLLSFLMSGCSTMGTVAKGTFTTAKGIYAVQPKSVTDNYPHFFKKTFYTAELLTTDYSEWKIRLISKENIDLYLSNNPINAELKYEVDFVTNKEITELKLEATSIQDDGRYIYDFSFSPQGRPFWSGYHEHLFNFDKPWFNYTISPEIPSTIKNSIIAIHYNYAPNWGFISLREFMELFDFMTEKRWSEFCFWKEYSFDDSSVCGNIEVEDLDG